MLKFELDGINVEIEAELERHEYTDSNRYKHSRFERKMEIRVKFWEFVISGNLQDLSLIKSSLTYFMQGYWKRSGAEASRIGLNTNIFKYHSLDYAWLLNFSDRQKNKKSSLRVRLEKNGRMQHEIYLDGQQVLMLDVAIGKALSLLSPRITP
ncbi:MAG: hypothetical protein KJ990_14355 [Proteobacteria bacterium]|nr:hypothetical protein [Pseudomonadota bacterium]MBU1650563.1 hypothetical protein [Pseudomonadota bacterium]